ncbi:MAG TPA: hypothetical protein VE505_15720 [Vicinamibacterales bacterium]|nr:hypothetical protein [Vicinamibacterales bacterium]
MRLKKRFVGLAALVGAIAALSTVAFAVSNAHFVGTPTATRDDTTLTISGKVAGLGQVEVITVAITGDALCINPGAKHPRAANKADVAGGADVPVQNGKANFSVPATATFEPECSPPMTVVFENVCVTVTAADGTNLVFCFPGRL